MKIVGRAPSRISLFGGGTDIPSYADKYGGIAINFAINIYQDMTLYYHDPKGASDYPTKTIVPPDGNHDFIYKILNKYHLGNGVHLASVQSFYDGVLNSGLGASAAAAVLLLALINKAQALGMSKEQLAETAWRLETEDLGLYGGRQDQYAAALGGFNSLLFVPGQLEILPLGQTFADKIIPAISLFYTGHNRQDPKIQEGFRELSQEQVDTLDAIKLLAVEGSKALVAGDIEKVGHLLHESWELKKQTNKGVSTPEIDKIYAKARGLGAYGGKVCGAGGGGFMYFISDPAKKQDLIKGLQKDLLPWDFEVDWTGVTTRIINKWEE